MRTFQTIFLTTYFVGEGLSGFLPSVFALIQGTQEFKCINRTVFNETTNTSSSEIAPEYISPRLALLGIFLNQCS